MGRVLAMTPKASAPTAPADPKVRNGIILLHGDDVPMAIFEEVAELVSRRLRGEPIDFMVSGADPEAYDYFDEECQ